MRYLKFFILFILLFLSNNVYALETTTVYTAPNKNVSGSIIWLDLTTPKTQSLGVLQSTASYGFRFFIDKSTQIGKVYKIRLNFNDYDYLHSNTSNYWRIVGYSGISVTGDCSLIGYELKNQGSNTQNKTVDVMYQCPSVNTGVMFYNENSSGDSLTRISTINWRLNSIQWEIIDSNEDIINNQTQNTQNIINNQNTNTQDIINNQNSIAEQQSDEQMVCGNSEYLLENGTISGTTGLNQDGDRKRTDFIKVLKNNTYTISTEINTTIYIFTYNENKEFVERLPNDWTSVPYNYINSNNIAYIRIITNNRQNSKIKIEGCKNGNQALSDDINDLNNSIKDDDVGGAASDAGDFITGFDTNTFGLTSIITSPLNLIQSLTSSSCSQLELPLPYLNNKKLILPCMSSIYQSTFGTLFTMYQTITFGIIAYWVCVRIFNMVKDFKNPDHDEVEVVDL